MGNLGAYQWVTTISKKVGGPFQLLGITALGGYVVFRGLEAGGKYVYKLFRKQKDKTTEKAVEAVKYTVETEGVSNEGVVFKVGEEFCVLETDGDAVLIDKIGDPNSPYFISKELFDQITKNTKEATK